MSETHKEREQAFDKWWHLTIHNGLLPDAKETLAREAYYAAWGGSDAAELGRLRSDLAKARLTLIEAGHHVGAALSDQCTTEFLTGVGEEVGLVVTRLRAEVERLTAVDAKRFALFQGRNDDLAAAERQRDAAEQALALAREVPEGWRLVPVEITPEIACALEDAAPPDAWRGGDPHGAIPQLMKDWGPAWSRALRSLPSSPQPSEPKGTAWQPIETADKNAQRLELWVAGQPKFGRWDDDKYAQKPRPFWTYEGFGRVDRTEQRKEQPTHWRFPPAGPHALPAPPSEPVKAPADGGR